jgi:hypothetical protein
MMEAVCVFCKLPIQSVERQGEREVTAWVAWRKAGGANQARLQQPTGRVAHKRCIDDLTRNRSPLQESLL